MAASPPAPSPVYQPSAGFYDEAVGPGGNVHPAWSEWMKLCETGGLPAFQAWTRATQRFAREIGVTYADDEGAEGSRSRWTLDPVPWIIGAGEWAAFEKGIHQRMRLCAAIFQDIYGPQRLIRERAVPLEIVYRHSGFIRPLCGLHDTVPHAPGLALAAFDVARGPDGRMWVINQRGDTPFGLGFALENRSILSRVLPSTFQTCQVRRLATFFRSLRQELESSPGFSSDPRIVILTGEHSKGDFENTFLANYLGYTRVVPGDLTVRDRRVWLRSLGGLQPVHAIWRAMPGRSSDALESEFRLHGGIPGLFEAIRAGHVMVFNHPGSGILDSPGWHPYLPAISRLLLGEELILPAVATWWCGAPSAHQHVQANLAHMVVKTVDGRSRFQTAYGNHLETSELEALSRRIAADPGMFVGQEAVHFSTVPSLQEDHLEPRSAVLRTYALQTRRDQIHVLPGGLARTSASERFIVSTHAGGISKDVWVRSRTVEPRHVSLWKAEPEVPDVLDPSHIPSRTGENLFWTGRYAERADSMARFLRRLLTCRAEGLDQPIEIEEKHERFLLRTLLHVMEVSPLVSNAEPDVQAELSSLLENPTRTGGLAHTLQSFRRAAHEIRDLWSTMSVQAIEACADGWSDATALSNSVFDYYAPLDRLLLDLSAFIGLNLESMTRDPGWCLLDAGRRIERAMILTGLLEYGIAKPVDDDIDLLVLESVLVISDSLVTFRRRYRRELRPHRIVDLLVCVPNNPRSLAYQLERLQRMLADLPREDSSKPDRILKLILEAERMLESISLQKIVEKSDRTGARAGLAAFLKQMRKTLSVVSDEITVSYFSHAARTSSR